MQATIMEVNLDNFLYNVNKIKEYTSNKTIIPVIKANAYGTYINERIDIVNIFDIVAVARVSEGVSLRKNGYKKDILILNQPYYEEIEDIIKNNLTIGLSNYEFLELLIKNNKKVKIHLEIETGMNRTGINPKEIDIFIDKIKSSKNIIVEGVYTHLSSADYDINYTNKQLSIFKECIEILKQEFNLKYIHSSASNGLLNFDDGVSNAIRPGIILYGYESFKGVYNIINLKPVCKLKTKIIFLKDVGKKESIGYSRKHKTTKKTRIATIPIGYADGLTRNFAKKGYVIVNNKKAKILGNICMDSSMIDVSDIDAKLNDDVYIWDNKNQSLDDIAKIMGTINYEVMCNISNRVIRVFHKNKNNVKKIK